MDALILFTIFIFICYTILCVLGGMLSFLWNIIAIALHLPIINTKIGIAIVLLLILIGKLIFPKK